MKTSFCLLLTSIFSFSALGMTSSIVENYDLLTERNKAKVNKGEVIAVKMLKKEDALLIDPGSPNQGLGAVNQLIVDTRSCFASLFIEEVYYSTEMRSSCGDEHIYEYIDYANVAVDVDFRTFSHDYTDVHVILYATKKSTGAYYQIGEEFFTYQSDLYGAATLSVVFLVDGSYAKDYYISADVFLDDEYGPACDLSTNEEVIY